MHLRAYISAFAVTAALLGGPALSAQTDSTAKAQADKPAPVKHYIKPQANGKILLIGTVLSTEEYEAIPKVAVMITGTEEGVLTDENGNYRMEVPADTKSITYSCMGYLTKELKLTYNPVVFKVVYLDESAETLNEAVVTAFGTTQSKENVVSSVDAADTRKFGGGDGDLSTSFSGNIAGIMATQLSGEPGGGSLFSIRGSSTFGRSTEPLYILDGVEVSRDVINGLSAESIATMSILKDAGATALYGSRGANGAIVVTTKTGTSSNRISINVHMNGTLLTPTDFQGVADGVTYMENYNEARLTRGAEPFYPQEKIDGTRSHADKYLYPDVDWYKLIFKDLSYSDQTILNVRGGGNRVNYFLSATAYHEQGMLRDSDDVDYGTNIDFRRYTVVSNVTAKVTKYSKLAIRMNTQFVYQDRPYYGVDTIFRWAMEANPVEFSPTYPRSWVPGANYVVYGNAVSWDTNSTSLNPYAELSKGYRKAYTNNTTMSMRYDYNLNKLVKGLKFWAQVAITNKAYSQRVYYRNPHYFTLTGYHDDPNTGRRSYDLDMIGSVGTNFFTYNINRNGFRKLTLQGTVEYSRTIRGDHFVHGVLVYNQESKVDNQPTTYYQTLPEREQSLAFRGGYRYKMRYLAELNLGYNGSENFAHGMRWGFFPAVAGGWIISREPFFRPLLPVVSYLKFKASYGLSGNDNIAQRFPYLSELNMNYATTFYKGSNSFTRQRGNEYRSLGNAGTTWELSRKFNAGFDATLGKDITLSAEWFRENRSGIFMQLNLPSYMGLSGMKPYDNIGAVRNQGVESSIRYNHMFNENFYVSADANFTYAHNEITAYNESKYKKYGNTSRVGHPIDSIFGLTAEGLFGSQAEIAASPVQTYTPDYMPGDIKYRDINGDGRIDDNDMSVIGKPTVPEIQYGFGGTIGWKSWDLSLRFQGRDRVSILMMDIHPFRDNSRQGYNMMQWIADDHWSENNPKADAAYPRLDYKYNLNNTEPSTFWVRDGRFLRLKQVELGYSFKKSARIYLQGYNLFMLSPFRYWDAEKGSGNGLTYPLKRSYRLGLKLSF
ncbi:MAG: TonB-dependent receptor [Bacteroidales bacterium]|nr:TonB-dependent receptor [Bacteroidales bacterium]